MLSMTNHNHYMIAQRNANLHNNLFGFIDSRNKTSYTQAHILYPNLMLLSRVKQVCLALFREVCPPPIAP